MGLQTRIRILKATVMTVVKYGSETLTLQKMDEASLDVFQRNCLQIFLGACLTSPISNGKLNKKILLYHAF